MLNSAPSCVAKFIKIAPECALKPSPCGCSPAFLQRHQVHEDPGGAVYWEEGVCSDAGWPGHCQHLWFPRTSGKVPEHLPLAQATDVKQCYSCSCSRSNRQQWGKGSTGSLRSCKEKCRLIFFHGVSHQQLFFSMYLDVGCILVDDLWISLDFTKVWIFNISPCLGEKKINLPSSLFSSFTFFHYSSIATHQGSSHFKICRGRKATVWCIFISLKLFWSSWNDEKLETAKKKQPEKWGQVNPSHLSPWHHPNIFHFILFSKNNNRKQTFLSSYQVSFVNTQKGNCFYSLLP